MRVALALSPNYADALDVLAGWLASAERYDEAVSVQARLVVLRPTDVAVSERLERWRSLMPPVAPAPPDVAVAFTARTDPFRWD